MTQDQGNRSADDPLAAWFLGGALVLVAGGLLWYFGHAQIANAVRWLRVGEIYLLAPFVRLFTPEIDRIQAYLLRADPAFLTFGDVVAMSRAVGSYMRYPVAAVLFAMAAWAFLSAPQANFRKKYQLETLIPVQARTWKVIAPITLCNPALSTRAPGQPIEIPLEPWAEALSPEEWLAVEGVGFADGQLDTVAAEKAFAKQLCGPWRGVKALPPHLQGLLAAFVLKAERRRSEGRQMLEALAVSWSPKTGMAMPESLRRTIGRHVADKKLMAGTLEAADRHGWVATAMLAALQHARRQGGVLAPAEFLWLRPTRRALWYPLNGLGGLAFYTEASGAMAHYQAEVAKGGPLTRPAVNAAVRAMEDYLKNNAVLIPKTKRAGTDAAASKRTRKSSSEA